MRIQATHLPWKTVREVVQFYFAWKTTEAYICYRVHNARGAGAAVFFFFVAATAAAAADSPHWTHPPACLRVVMRQAPTARPGAP